MLVVLEHHMKRKTYQFSITHFLQFFFHQKDNQQYKYKISHTILSLDFKLAGFLAIQIQFVYYQQRKQVYCANIYMKLDFVPRDPQKYNLRSFDK